MASAPKATTGKSCVEPVHSHHTSKVLCQKCETRGHDQFAGADNIEWKATCSGLRGTSRTSQTQAMEGTLRHSQLLQLAILEGRRCVQRAMNWSEHQHKQPFSTCVQNLASVARVNAYQRGLPRSRSRSPSTVTACPRTSVDTPRKEVLVLYVMFGACK